RRPGGGNFRRSRHPPGRGSDAVVVAGSARAHGGGHALRVRGPWRGRARLLARRDRGRADRGRDAPERAPVRRALVVRVRARRRRDPPAALAVGLAAATTTAAAAGFALLAVLGRVPPQPGALLAVDCPSVAIRCRPTGWTSVPLGLVGGVLASVAWTFRRTRPQREARRRGRRNWSSGRRLRVA